jgi:hypothetical protein
MSELHTLGGTARRTRMLQLVRADSQDRYERQSGLMTPGAAGGRA